MRTSWLSSEAEPRRGPHREPVARSVVVADAAEGAEPRDRRLAQRIRVRLGHRLVGIPVGVEVAQAPVARRLAMDFSPPRSGRATDFPHKHACQMTLIGEPTRNSNFAEWCSA